MSSGIRLRSNADIEVTVTNWIWGGSRIMRVTLRKKLIMLLVSMLLWSECLCPPTPRFTCWTPNAQCDGIRRWMPWKVIRSWGWNHHEWDWCSYKKDPTELPSPFFHVSIQQEVSNPEEGPHLTMLAPRS